MLLSQQQKVHANLSPLPKTSCLPLLDTKRARDAMTFVNSRSTCAGLKPPLHSHRALSLYLPNILLVRLLLHVLVPVLVLVMLTFVLTYRSRSEYLVELGVKGEIRC